MGKQRGGHTRQKRPDRARPVFDPVRVPLEFMFKNKWQAPPAPPRLMAQVGRHGMVRYRRGSKELQADLIKVGLPHKDAYLYGAFDIHAAVMGILDEHGEPEVILDVTTDDSDGGPRISLVHVHDGHTLSPDEMAGLLSVLDIPASWRTGADTDIRERFDVSFSAGSGWSAIPPVHLVRVTMERACFSTSPSAWERIDMLLPMDERHDLLSADRACAEEARHHYRSEGFARMPDMPERTGFSSWMPGEDVVVVKVVGKLDMGMADPHTTPEAVYR